MLRIVSIAAFPLAVCLLITVRLFIYRIVYYFGTFIPKINVILANLGPPTSISCWQSLIFMQNRRNRLAMVKFSFKFSAF